jgi:ribonuclease HI
MKVITYTDGGARGNPGPAAYGVVIKDESGKILFSEGKYIGQTTNNQAEYQGLVAALESAQKLGATEADCYLDSELIVKQMKREYKVKDLGLQAQFIKAWNLINNFKKVSFTHIRREFNKEADALVNQALDKNI